MKKHVALLFSLLILLVLTACTVQINRNSSEEPHIYVEGVKNVDVLNTHGNIEGIERMSSFYTNVQNGVASKLRVVHYTLEGDPIITDLIYNGKTLEVKKDYTHDKFGNPTIHRDSCGTLIEEVNPLNTAYIAVDCNEGFNGLHEILYINYKMNNVQNLFEFTLVYGANGEYEINSQNEAIIDNVKQEVYKKLMFGNYFYEKELEASCDTGDTFNYSLEVLINRGPFKLQWSECDDSLDAERLTTIAKYIIEQAEQEQKEHSPMTVQGYVLEITDNELLIGEGLTMLDYDWVVEELPQINFKNSIFEFTYLSGANTTEFTPGDKIVATIEGSKTDSKPARAVVKDIKKIEVY
ncbi:DUF4362 domain-containing protein [Bacillus alkalicellulosilyticus]|uniref:DUF4362 domain-containing protein n=1 Tax=Alkalihalobacterium alkalicellulosilyticum TaxID=1912214 RepID=UPI0009967EBA|nr:DUF4362 domain-containing protein [Bacillus alkalicellulosilyticus]